MTRLLIPLMTALSLSVPAPSSAQSVQVQQPVFRAGVYVVPLTLTLMYNKKPMVGLTEHDFAIVFDGKPGRVLDLSTEDKTPGQYSFFVEPPAEMRDGRSHNLQIKVKRPNSGKWTTLPFKRAITIPKSG